MSKLIKSVIHYVGGKYFMIKHLLPLIPPHNIYVEVFGGAANLLLNKPPSTIEVYNDINSELVTLFRVIRDKDKLEELKRLLYLTPLSREEYYHLKYQNTETLSDIERAYRFYYLCRTSFNGIPERSFAYPTPGRNRAVYYFNSIDKLDLIYERFKYVTIEHESFEKIIPRYNYPDTLFYLDPPYIHDTRNDTRVYQHEMSNEQHEQLVSLLLNIKGMCILSCYMHDMYNILIENNWGVIEIESVAHVKGYKKYTPEHIKNKKLHDKRTEIIFLNPQCINALKQSNIFPN